jgi:hypothetical protein
MAPMAILRLQTFCLTCSRKELVVMHCPSLQSACFQPFTNMLGIFLQTELEHVFFCALQKPEFLGIENG